MQIHKIEIGHWLKKLAITSACLILPLSEAFAVPVIPGAAGFGMDTPAGRGGKVYKVTNLEAAGAGSLKACIDASGPRTCVFEVSGTINLSRDLDVSNPYITIAGQTAPSPGITIRGAALWVKTSHVMIQHMRFRAGDDRNGPNPDDRNSLKISSHNERIRNVVIANSSMSWGIDQVSNVYGENVTFYRNIFSEGLRDSLHSKGPHSMGMTIREQNWAGDPVKITMVGNLFAHNYGRNPITAAPDFIFVNNVIYNWGNRGSTLKGRDGVVSRNSIVGNYYKAGRNSSNNHAILLQGSGKSSDMTSGSKVYVDDNITPSFDGKNPRSAVNKESGLGNSIWASSPPTWNNGLEAISAQAAYEWVLTSAGSRPSDRDSVDFRIIQDVRDGSGTTIDSPWNVGGWPALAENHRRLSLPANPNEDNDGNGYTNLEEWLHSMAAQVEGPHQEGEVAPPRSPSKLTIQ